MNYSIQVKRRNSLYTLLTANTPERTSRLTSGYRLFSLRVAINGGESWEKQHAVILKINSKPFRLRLYLKELHRKKSVVKQPGNLDRNYAERNYSSVIELSSMAMWSIWLLQDKILIERNSGIGVIARIIALGISWTKIGHADDCLCSVRSAVLYLSFTKWQFDDKFM